MAVDIQSEHQNSQNYEIDISKIYSQMISYIDGHRSYVNTSSLIQESISKGLPKVNDLREFVNKHKVKEESTPQESRCHAFYRIIGFPVVSSNFNFYNPGLFNMKLLDSKIGNLKKRSEDQLNIAKNQIPGFWNLSLQRETDVLNKLKVFSTNQTIDASALTLSILNKRDFSITFKNLSKLTFDTSGMNINNQSYQANLNGNIVSIEENNIQSPFSLIDYIDSSGAKPNINNLFITRYHIIFPFIVDPIIDGTVCPTSNLIAVPFTPDESNRHVSENTLVDFPLIEKIIQAKFDFNINEQVMNQNIQDFFADKDNNSFYQSNVVQNVLKQKSSNSAFEKNELIKYINIIEAMIKILKDAKDICSKIQFGYYWLPIPSTIGPEGGCTVRDIIISKAIAENTKFITHNDSNIIKQILNTSTTNANKTISKNILDIFSPDENDAFGDTAQDQLERLISERNENISKGSDALKTIEIITGEISGFGLCDIIAILGALNIMPKDQIIGFLDDYAFANMESKYNTGLKRPTIVDTMNKFLPYVVGFYDLMDKAYKTNFNGKVNNA